MFYWTKHWKNWFIGSNWEQHITVNSFSGDEPIHFHIKVQILKGSISFHFNDSIIEINNNQLKHDKLYIPTLSGGFENLLKEEDERNFYIIFKLI
jgi:hypothetical protein